MTIRIAGWSGPRNRSTALMRSFEARGDCAVTDEPLYAHYLASTGLEHPLREEVLASQSQDWREVAGALCGKRDRALWYQKHMAHHLLPEIGRAWLAHQRHILWIRHPRAVVGSYARKRGTVCPRDLGLLQQLELWTWLRQRGLSVIVVDTAELFADPAAGLEAVCGALKIPWTPRMLAWAPGPHPDDGVWARHWYAAVWASHGFLGVGEPERVPEPLEPVVEALLPAWTRLSSVRLSLC